VQALARRGRALDRSRGRICAIKLGGWAPTDLLLHGAEESARDRAEGERLAYVAATRARDVLIVPAIGDEVYDGGWLDPLMPAIYPPLAERRTPSAAPAVRPSRRRTPCCGAPTATRAPDDSRPGEVPFQTTLMRTPPTRGPRPPTPRPADYRVVWWDPHALALDAGASFGLRRDDLIAKDGDGGAAASGSPHTGNGKSARSAAIAEGRTPSIASRTVTQMAAERDLPLFDLAEVRIDVVDVPRVIGRPFGPRFGTLVHTTLATVPSTPTSPSSAVSRQRRAGCCLARGRR
jgi:hypothetical protein